MSIYANEQTLLPRQFYPKNYPNSRVITLFAACHYAWQWGCRPLAALLPLRGSVPKLSANREHLFLPSSYLCVTPDIPLHSRRFFFSYYWTESSYWVSFVACTLGILLLRRLRLILLLLRRSSLDKLLALWLTSFCHQFDVLVLWPLGVPFVGWSIPSMCAYLFIMYSYTNWLFEADCFFFMRIFVVISGCCIQPLLGSPPLWFF